MTTSKMRTVKRLISQSIDQHVSLKMDNASNQDTKILNAEKLRPGNGGIKMINIDNMLQVFFLHHTGEKYTTVMPNKRLFGLTQAQSLRVLPLKSMDQPSKLPLRLLLTLQLTKLLSLLTFNQKTQLIGSIQDKTTPTDVDKSKHGTSHTVSMDMTQKKPKLDSLQT